MCASAEQPAKRPAARPQPAARVTAADLQPLEDVRKAAAAALYASYYREGLVRFVPDPDESGFLSAGAYAGRDDMAVSVLGSEDRLLLVARFDNLGKGASGAAIQNMNLLLGLPEETGLVTQ